MFRSGLTPKNLILEPFASALAVLDKDELQEGVCLVDIGGGTTDVAIFLDGIIRHNSSHSIRRKCYNKRYWGQGIQIFSYNRDVKN